MTRLLDNIRILDLSRILAGPWATQILSDLGAEVIKVERPDGGDDSRTFPPVFMKDADGKPTRESAFYLCANRNKKSITVDISTSKGQEIIKQLAKVSDVVVENYMVGTLARYGLDEASLRGINPHLIYCSITGFGQTGPYRDRPGYDPIFQAMSGLMSVTGEPDRPPMKVGPSIVDIITGLYACVAVLSALYKRDVNDSPRRRGQSIDLALLDAAIASMSHMATGYLIAGDVPQRRGAEGNGGTPSRTMRCLDGHCYIVVGNDSQFRRFCAAIGRPELGTDPRFLTNADRLANRPALIPEIEVVSSKMTVQQFTDTLNASGVPAAPIYDMAQVFADPQVIHREMSVNVDHSLAGGRISLVANPIKFSDTPIENYTAPPTIGQHTTEVLEGVVGMSVEAIEVLRRQKII